MVPGYYIKIGLILTNMFWELPSWELSISPLCNMQLFFVIIFGPLSFDYAYNKI